MKNSRAMLDAFERFCVFNVLQILITKFLQREIAIDELLIFFLKVVILHDENCVFFYERYVALDKLFKIVHKTLLFLLLFHKELNCLYHLALQNAFFIVDVVLVNLDVTQSCVGDKFLTFT